MSKDFNNETQFNIYKIDTQPKLLKSRVMIFAIVVLFLILLILSINVCRRNYIRDKQFACYNDELILIKEEKELEIKKREEEKERIRLSRLPNLTDVGIENMKHIYSSDKKRAFLTFDDGPSSVTHRILDVLKQENVPATFFVLGNMIPGREDLLKRVYNEGHFIASHGYTHVYSSIYSSPQAVLDEHNNCVQAIRNAIGVQEYDPHLFRFPGGYYGGKYAEVKKQAKDLLLQNNVLNVDWNALNGDGETNNLSIDFELQRIDETVGNRMSIVVLMHDAPAKSVTADALPLIIKSLREKGYEFVNFYDVIK